MPIKFELQAAKTPTRGAVSFENETLAYAELNERANRLAHYLIGRGIGPEDVVALAFPRSADLIVAILGVLKAGAAYLPLDPDHPAERIAFMLGDARPALVLGSDAMSVSSDVPQVVLADPAVAAAMADQPSADPTDEQRLHRLTPDSPAYVIYTSGSTGRPKGVVIPHRNVLRLFTATDRWFGFGPDDVWTLFHSAAFDFSVWELWGALLHGGRVVVVPYETSRSPDRFLGLLVREGVTVLNQTPSAFYQLVQADQNNPELGASLRLRTVIFGGEALDPPRLADWYRRHAYDAPRLVNMYGITETTVHVTYAPLDDPASIASPASVIGTGIPDLVTHVLDERLAPVPDGTVGELYVAGGGVARGYLNRPGLTAQRFIAGLDGVPGARMYRTGDLVRRNARGELEYQGRADGQVKIRGVRIEPGEIESVLAEHPGVEQAAVMVHQDGADDRRLVAYVVPGSGSVPVSEDAVDEHVAHWQQVFDAEYADAASALFGENFVGWASSYGDGAPIPLDQMREWRDTTLERVRALRPRRVLEIGVGTGLLLAHLAPECETYWGTDLSSQVITALRAQVERDERLAGRVVLRSQAAHEVDGLPEGTFDVVLINSVTQCFPSGQYLVDVLRAAVRLAAPGGAVFVGDMRDLRSVRLFRAGIQLDKALPGDDLVAVRHAIERSLLLEKDLLVDPDFFAAFCRTEPHVRGMAVEIKKGRHHNELTRYRYDTVLYKDSPALKDLGSVPPLRFGRDMPDVPALARRLAAGDREPIRLEGVPNGRLVHEIAAVRALDHGAGLPEVLDAFACHGGVDPEELYDLGEKYGYRVHLTWARQLGELDAVFLPAGDAPEDVRPFATYRPVNGDGDPVAFTNNPVASRDSVAVGAAVRAFARERLPEYMVPSAVVVVDRLPLTPNGKLDRAALPTPSWESGGGRGPRDPREEVLCGLFAQVLGVERVGIDDGFFDLGGHSLLATRLISAIRDTLHVELPIRALFEEQTVAGLSGRLDAEADVRPALTPRTRPERVPLSFAQRRLWFLNRLEGPSATYNVPWALRFHGALDVKALRAALADVVARHEALRTVFPEHDGEPYQVILSPDEAEPVLEIVERADPARLEESLAAAARRGFDLGGELLVRAKLFVLGPDDHVLLLLMHHIVCDGWSAAPLSRDLMVSYQARRAGVPNALPELPVQYVDYTLWQRELLGDPDDPRSVLARQTAYWRDRLAGLPEQIQLPADRSRPPVASYDGDIHAFAWDPDLHRDLSALARESGASLFMVLQAGLAALLSRLGAGTDIPIGTPIAGRTDRAMDDLVGFFVNSLVLRVDTSGDPSFRDLLQRVRETALAAYANQDVPFEHLVEVLNPGRSVAYQPLFQVVLALQNAPDGVEGGDVEIVHHEALTGKSRLDLVVRVHEETRGTTSALAGVVEFSTDLFDRDTVAALVGRLERILCAVVADPGIVLGRLDVLGDDERSALAVAGSGGPLPLDAASLALGDLFAAQVARSPHAVAVSSGSSGTPGPVSLTYAELDARASALAARLRAVGVGPEAAVLLLMERSVDLVVAVLAVIKAGGAYVPIDLRFPASRVEAMAAETGARVAVADPSLLPRVPAGVRGVCVGEDAGALAGDDPVTVAGGDLAYIMYTSGSSGTPKGVAVTHRDVAALALGSTREAAAGGRVLCHSPVAFDASTFELWAPLLSGGEVVVAPAGELDVSVLAKVIAGRGVTGLWVTAGLFSVLAEEFPGCFAGVRQVWTGGDVVAPEATRRVLAASPGVRVVNGYGPTEATTFALFHPVDELAADAVVVPIGRPLDGMRVYVLDRFLQPVPVGVVGELYVAGAGVARGYVGRGALTAERFVAEPHGPAGSRMYRTGDLVRWTAQRVVEFAGRADSQVKIRGFRVEPGEVEVVLASHPGVEHALVIAREDTPGDKRLIAYVVPDGEAPADPDVLRAYARTRLPEYMLPADVVTLDRLPLTLNGKLDRAALPAPAPDLARGRTARTAQEAVLCALFAEVLGVPEVGIDDAFFDLGGHSLLVTRLLNRIRTVLGVEIPTRVLFETPTVGGLTARLPEAFGGRPAMKPRPRPSLIPLAFAQRRLWFLHRLEGPSATYNIPIAVRLSGELDQAALRTALGHLVARHETLRTVFPDTRGVPSQRILDPAEVPVRLETRAVEEDALPEALAAAARYAFDLTREPPARFHLFSLAADEHVLLVLLHHIAADGWSLAPLARDLGAAYNAARRGEEPALPELPVQYADYALWQGELLGDAGDSGSLLGAGIDFWRRALEGAPEELMLPVDGLRPAVADHRGDSVRVTLPAGLHQALAGLARQCRVSEFMLMQAAVAVLMTKLGAGEDIPIGSPFAGRGDEALDDLVGFFVNTLVLRADTSGEPTFREVVERVREVNLSAYAHQDMPFERLVEELHPQRSLARHPLFQVFLAFRAAEPAPFDLDGLTAAHQHVDLGAAKFDLAFDLAATYAPGRRAGRPGPDGIHVVLEYRTDLFTRSTAESVATRLLALVEQVVADPDRPIGRLEILTAGERRKILTVWNDTAHEVERLDDTVTGRFAAQVRRTPDAVAVRANDGQLTYCELDERANRLAHRLIRLGVRPEDGVAVLHGRSSGLVVATLAILKAGGTYVPLHTGYPVRRMRLAMEETGATVLLTDQETPAEELASGVPVVHADDPGLASEPHTPPATEPRPDRLAYVMYTSGSTGAPKGIGVTHRDVLALALDRVWASDESSRVLLHSPYAFDISTYELWTPLLTGGRIVVAPPGEINAHDLRRVIEDEGVTSLLVAAGLFGVVADVLPETFATVRRVLTGGDVVSPVAVRRVLDHCPGTEVTALYGPTEITLTCTSHLMRASREVPGGVPIGRPMDNRSAYVLDAFLQPVPPGVPGELYIGGEGVARGYVRRAALTAERFVADPFGPAGARLYRTGDVVRWNAAGVLEFIGRTDDQIKIRGFRVEPGEVEALLAERPDVVRGTVAVRADHHGHKRLVAYIVPAPGERPDPGDVLAGLANRLPDYMVPSAVVTLERLPLTPNGKLDRATLPTPGWEAGGRAPGTPREEAMCALFAEVLGVERVGVDDDFFDLGGHSLLAIRLTGEIRETMGVEVSLRGLFEASSVARLLERMDHGGETRLALERRERPERIPLSYAQRRLWFLDRMEGPSATYNVSWTLRMRGRLDPEALRGALGDVVARHEALRTVFEELDGNPYQVILAPERAFSAFEVIRVDVAGLQEAMNRASRHVFDLAGEIPMRAFVFTTGPEEHVLLLLMHHIVCDHWSLTPLARDLATAYRARRSGESPEFHDLPVQYADYALWQREVLGDQGEDGSRLVEQLAYWRGRLAGLPERIALPADRPRPPVASYRGDVLTFGWDAELHEGLLRLAREHGASLYMVVQAGFAALLSRLGAGTDVPVGVPIAGRGDHALDDLVGFFVNTLVIRTDTSGEPSFAELLGRVRDVALEAYANQDVPFEHLVEELNPARSMAHHPLFQVSLAVQNAPAEDLGIAELETGPGPVPRTGISRFDLFLSLTERHGTAAGLDGVAEFSTDLFDQATVEVLVERLRRLLAAAVADPGRRVGALEILDAAERDVLLVERNATAAPVEAVTVPDLLAAEVARRPEAPAVVAADGELTFAELHERVNRLARVLIGRGAGPERVVAIVVPRSMDMIVALLAVMTTGAAYLPMDPEHPAERLGYMLADADPVAVVTTGQVAGRLPAG
ncbi:amino acid adenylation domain-containing protein, partial [Sphaerisporangium sp. NPDC051017]|uniref:amino acid adenylation domain-containing protein n=1 Tax=Sphaerisporangium sp. NPDC051017 TaxID=3154636 RepID=UPI00344474CA